MVNASIHNELSKMKYYHKKTKDKQLLQEIEKITQQLQLVNEAKTYDELLLIEARAKQIYYNFLSKMKISSLIKERDNHHKTISMH